MTTGGVAGSAWAQFGGLVLGGLIVAGLLADTADGPHSKLVVLFLSGVGVALTAALVLERRGTIGLNRGLRLVLSCGVAAAVVGAVLVSWRSETSSSIEGRDAEPALPPERGSNELTVVRGAEAPEATIRVNDSQEFFVESTPVRVAFLGMTGPSAAELRMVTNDVECLSAREAAQGLVAIVASTLDRGVAGRYWLRLSVKTVRPNSVVIRIERLEGLLAGPGESVCPGSP